MTTERILVTGGTGAVGQHVVKLLLKKGVEFSVFVRDMEKAKKMFGDKLNYLKGELHNFNSFRAAVKGHSRVFLLSSTDLVEIELAKIALEEGVKHVVRVSVLFANANEEQGTIPQVHGQVDQALFALKGMAVTSLRPHYFMQNFLRDLQTFKEKGVFYNNHEGAQVSLIDTEDIAACAVAVLTGPIEDNAGKSYSLTGPEALASDEQAAIFSKVLQRPIQSVKVDDATTFKTLRSMGMDNKWATYLVNLGIHYRLHLTGNKWSNGNVEILTGKKAKSFEAFVTQNKAAFTQ